MVRNRSSQIFVRRRWRIGKNRFYDTVATDIYTRHPTRSKKFIYLSISLRRKRHSIAFGSPILLNGLRTLLTAYKSELHSLRQIFVIYSLQMRKRLLTIRTGCCEEHYATHTFSKLRSGHRRAIIHGHGKVWNTVTCGKGRSCLFFLYAGSG